MASSRTRTAFRWVSAATVAATWIGVGVGGVAPGQAATDPGWRLAATFGAATGQTAITGLSATGPENAWGVGRTCPLNCAGENLLVVRWNGTGWRQMTLPPALRPDQQGGVIGASSTKNVWIFTGSDGPATRERAIHFDGRGWSGFLLPAAVGITGTAVFSTTNVWAFGSYDGGPKSGQQYNLRYDGHSWRRVTLPASADFVSAVSADDIWASGAVPAGPHSTKVIDVAMHWNGRSWSTLKFPRIHPPAGWTAGAYLAVALGPKNVWGQYAFSKGGCCRAGGLLHWNGAAGTG